MSLNVVNLQQIELFKFSLKQEFSHPLLLVYIDSKVDHFLKNSFFYKDVAFDDLTPEEKELVKQKPGVYQRVILNPGLYSKLKEDCSLVATRVGKGELKDAQDVTNLPNIEKVHHSLQSLFVWEKGVYQVKTLNTQSLLHQEGELMKNCIGKQDRNLRHYEYFSLFYEGVPTVSFKIERHSKFLLEAREKFNKRLSDSQHKAAIENFLKDVYGKDQSMYLSIPRMGNLVTGGLIVMCGTIGTLSFLWSHFTSTPWVMSFDLGTLVRIQLFHLGTTIMIPVLFETRTIDCSFVVKRVPVFKKVIRWING